jgi:hypothetical protein
MGKQFVILFVFAMALVACKKDKIEENSGANTSSLTLELNHLWDGDSLYLDSTYIHATTQDTFNFTTFKYYISNIRLKNESGVWYSIPESYSLVSIANGSKTALTISGIPNNNYTDIELLFGVDSLRNISGAQTGALATTYGMFWSWNTGYIMLKAEGLSPNSSTNSFAFHLGGFQGVNKVIQTKNFDLTTQQTLTINGNNQNKIGLNINASSMWNNSPTLATTSDLQMAGSAAKNMADNFMNGWSLGYVQN